MKRVDAERLEPGQKVIHRRYGVCIVREVMITEGLLFGVFIRPDNQNGRDLLREDCGCDSFRAPDMLEDLIRDLSIEKAPAEPGEKPIDHLTAWGEPEKDLPRQETKNHFTPEGEGVPE